MKNIAVLNAQDNYVSKLEATPITSDKKVAVIGAGVAGLATAAYLRRNGVDVTVFEKREKPYGVIQYVIPGFRIDQAIIEKDFNLIKNYGVNFEFGVNDNFVIEDLKKNYDYIVLAIGTWKPLTVSLIDNENKAIHASRPYKESSITQLAKVIKVLNKNQMRAKITPQTKEYLEKTLDERDLITKILLANQDILKPLLIAKLSKNNLDNTIIRTTTAFTMLQGANSANAIPEIAQVTVDFRILPTQTPEDVKKHIKKVLDRNAKGIKYNIEEISSQNPTKISNTKNEAFTTLKKEINSFFPSANIVPYMVPAGTDARNYDSLSDNVYRFLPISITDEDYALMHGVDENIGIENYSRMIDFYESFLKSNY
jgi:acetylornithine deacetylase/succinyl-diaminopimelate desuccinylase-like protein